MADTGSSLSALFNFANALWNILNFHDKISASQSVIYEL